MWGGGWGNVRRFYLTTKFNKILLRYSSRYNLGKKVFTPKEQFFEYFFFLSRCHVKVNCLMELIFRLWHRIINDNYSITYLDILDKL